VEGKEPGIILLSKLQPPEIKTKTLKRQRLLNVLARNLDKKVILLCAGPGYGKTTLLSHFLSRAKKKIVYYHLEKTDAEPAVFFSYLVAGIQKLKPSFGRKVAHLRHLFNQPQRYSDIIVGTFINEVVETMKEDTYVILEDYHALQPSAAVDKALDFLFRHMPANLHFIITSREKPELYFALMRTRDEFFELTGQQLRFNKGEIRKLFKETYSIPLKTRDLEWVEKYSEGWPVSLRLMIQSASYIEGISSSEHTKTLLGGYLQSQAGLFNYFAQEIYFQETVGMRSFLLDCSLFEWLDPELFDVASRRRNSGQVLSELAQRNAFVIRIPEHGYRLHNLFRDFLYSKFTDVKLKRDIFLRAAEFLSGKEKYDEAFNFYAKVREYKKMIAIVKRIGPLYTGQGRSGMFCSYVEQIPAKFRKRDPDLLIMYSRALTIMGRLRESWQSILKARTILKKIPRAKRKCADVLYTMGGISYTAGRFKSAMRYYRDALRMCPKGSSLTRASILNSLGSIHTVLGGNYLPKATSFYQKAYEIAERREYADIEASILNNWAMTEWKMGNLRAAYSKLSKITGMLAQYFSPGCGAGFFNAARLSILLGYTAEAKSILDIGMKTCSPYNDMWSMVALWSGYGLLYQEAEDLEKAKLYLNRSLQMADKLGVERLTVVAMNEMCKICLTGGDIIEAEKCMSSIWSLKKSRDDAEAIPFLLTEGMVRVAQGRYQDAQEVLTDALNLAERFSEIFHQFLISIELSRLFYLLNATAQSHIFLRRAMGTSREKGYDYLLLKKVRQNEWMMQAIRSQDIEQEYVRAIMKKSKLDIHWIDGCLFGVPKLAIDDQPVTDDMWQTSKTKKLFFYMLLQRGERVSGDRLIDTLWHEVSARKGSSSLRKAIQYIREVTRSKLGIKDELICLSKGMYQMATGTVTNLDVDEFETLVKRAREIADKGERRSLLEKMICIYKDGFASGWYDDWVEAIRLHYRSMYEECMIMLYDVAEKEGEYIEAMNISKRLVSMNFLDEKHHCRLMKVLAQLGRFGEIEQDFQAITKALRKELKTTPQKETVEVYEALSKAFSGG
jgi:LuxR family maltose regulon positive regulatory protein